MKVLRKLFILIMVVIMISGMIPFNNYRIGCVEEVNAHVNMTADDAIEWVKSKIGQAIDVDGVYGAQCVDLINAYYTFLGFHLVSGNGSDYTHNLLPTGYTRIEGAIPRKGDILVYTGGSKGYGHVAIYESVYSTYHQNFDGKQYVTHITDHAYDEMGTEYWGIIRPDFQSNNDIIGYLDVYSADENSVYVAGWTADFKSKNTNLEVQIFIGGVAETENSTTTDKHIVLANKKRADVENAFPGVGEYHGYEAILLTDLKGRQPIYVYAVNTENNCRVLIGRGYVNIGIGMKKADDGNWYYHRNGGIDRTYTGMAKNEYGWWYITNGKLDQTYTGMAKNEYGWWYMTNGMIDRTYTGMAKNKYGWWYISNGQLDRTYTGMAKNEYGWWYITNGQLDRKYTGIAQNQYGQWYISNGVVDRTFNGEITINQKVYAIKNGKVI